MATYEGEFHMLDFSGLIESIGDDDDDVLNDVWPSVLQEPEPEFIKHESEDGKVVLITESSSLDGQPKAYIIIRVSIHFSQYKLAFHVAHRDMGGIFMHTHTVDSYMLQLWATCKVI